MKLHRMVCLFAFAHCFVGALFADSRSCGNLLRAFNEIQATEPSRYLSQLDPRVPTFGVADRQRNMFCGPTCLYNDLQTVRKSKGLPLLTPEQFLSIASSRYRETSFDKLRGWFSVELGIAYQAALSATLNQPVPVTVKSIYSGWSSQPLVSIDPSRSFNKEDLARLSHGPAILQIDSHEGPSHFVSFKKFDPVENRIYFQPPESPNELFSSLLVPTTIQVNGQSYSTFAVSYYGQEWYLRATIRAHIDDLAPQSAIDDSRTLRVTSPLQTRDYWQNSGGF